MAKPQIVPRRPAPVPVDGNELFDERPVVIGGFKLTSRGAVPVGRPPIQQWSAALQFACASHEASPYWIADLMAYAEKREDYAEKLSQAMAVTGLAEQTLQNLGWIGRRVDQAARYLSPSVAHSAEVASMEPREQVQWLEQAKTEGWTVRDLRVNVRAAKRARVIEGQAELVGLFRVIYADPPWPYGDRPPSGSGAKDHYPAMTIEAMCQLPVAAHALPNSVLWMWIPAPIILEAPGPREVIQAWGFTPKTGRVWDKVKHGFGHYVEVRHEHLVICTRGSCLPDRPTPMLPSVVTERRSDVHSEKPASFRKDIERLYDGPYLELFGRQRVDGWTVFGNDARLWSQEA